MTRALHVANFMNTKSGLALTERIGRYLFYIEKLFRFSALLTF